MKRDLEILEIAPNDLVSAWETCIRNGMRAKIAVEDEIAKGIRANVGDFLIFFGLYINYKADRPH